jgi:hypothetical protein
MNKVTTIKKEGTGKFFAAIHQPINNGIESENVFLDGRFFKTEAAARRWLAKECPLCK